MSRQYELDYAGYYAYPYYWGGNGIWGDQIYPNGILAEYPDSGLMQAERAYANNEFTAAERAHHRSDDPHLRSCKEVIAHHIHASDGDIGHVESLLTDEKPGASATWWLTPATGG